MKESKNKSRLKRIKIPIKIRIPIITILGIILIISAYSTYASYQEPTTTEKEYTTISYRHSGIFDYITYLKNNTVYDNRTILYPGEGKIFKKITDHINASFTYNYQIAFIQNEKNTNISGNYNIQAEIQTNLWTKKYNLIPTTSFHSSEKTTSFKENFPINITLYDKIVDEINTEIGITQSNPILYIKCNIATTTKTENQTIYDSFTPTINVTLNTNTIEISENLSFTKSGSRTNTEEVFLQEVINQRENQTNISIICLALFIIPLIITRNKKEIITETEKMIKKINKKYGEWIVTVEEQPKIPMKIGVIRPKSFDDLIKTSEEINKPVIHYISERDKKHVFYVLDDTITYEYNINFI